MRTNRLLEMMLAPGPHRPVIRLGQSSQSGINEPAFLSDPSRLGPQRSTPPAPINVEACSSRGARRTQLSDSEPGGCRPINLLDINLNEPPPTDNNEPDEGGPSCQQYISLPVFRFQLPPGHRALGPIDAEELDGFDVVGFRNYDRASLRLPRDFDPMALVGPTSHLAQGRQPVAPVEPSLRPLRSPASRPIDVQQLYDDELEIIGPSNPMALVGQPAIHHAPEAQVEQSIQPQGSPPHGSIDVVELDSEDEHEDDDEDNSGDDDVDDDDNDDEEDYEEDDRNQDNYDDELERGPTNPMVRVGQPAIHHSLVVPVVQSILLQRSAPHGPIDVVHLDSDDNDDEDDDDDDDDDDIDHDHDHEEDDHDEEDDDVAAGDEDVIILSPLAFGQASSSRTTQGRTSLVDSESLQIADNHQPNKRKRVDSQPPVNIRDVNVHLVGTRSSMPAEPVAHPPLQPLASTSNCPVCMGPLGATSSMPMPVAPPPPQLPAFNCPICMEPLVEPTATRCGHLFCQSCLRTSVAVQARCPICRCKVSHRELNRIYFPKCH